MDATRIRVAVATTLMVGLAFPLLTASVAAATCTLTAPATVAIGTPMAIVGSDFPASTSVDVSLTVEGGSPDVFTVTSNATGAFLINLTPEAADEGTTTVVATAGPDCSAQVVFAVGAVTATPEPTEAAAGVGAGAPPRTDAASDLSWTSGARSGVWILALLTLAIGGVGLVATRPARMDRTGRPLPDR